MPLLTEASRVAGGGFQNCGAYAPAGVGHDWLCMSGGDTSAFFISSDGITYRPCNKGLYFGRHHASGIAGSLTVANRIYVTVSTSNSGGAGNGVMLRGTYSASTGLVTWTDNFATGFAGAVTGGFDRPRHAGRHFIALDEANGWAYACSDDGIWRINLSTGAATQRALNGATTRAIVLDPTDPTVGWVAVSSGGAGAGVYRVTNLPSGTVAETRQAFSWANDLAYLDAGGGTRYLYAALGGPTVSGGVQRWTISATIGTGWTNLSSDLNLSANGVACVDAVLSGGKILLLAGMGGNANNANGGAYSRDGGTTWVNQSDAAGWTTSYVPHGETSNWWLLNFTNRVAIDSNTWDAQACQYNPNDPTQMIWWGRSGGWSSRSSGATVKPLVRGICASFSHTVAAMPFVGGIALIGDTDWTSLKLGGTTTATGVDGISNTSSPVQVHQPASGASLGVGFDSAGDIAGIAGEYGDVYLSTNFTTANPTWAAQNFAGAGTCEGVAIGQDSGGSRVVLTLKSGSAIFRKVGSGTPTNVGGPSGAGNQVTHFCWPNGSTRRAFVYCSASNGLYRSSNHGGSWSSLFAYSNTSENTGNIFADPDNPDTLYLSRNDGLYKVTNASGSATMTHIGPTVTAAGPCAVDPNSGVVYLVVTGDNAGGTTLWASPSNNPGAGTTFTEVADEQFKSGPFYPVDACVTWSGKLIVVTQQGAAYVSEPGGTQPLPGTLTASATITQTITLTADATVVGQAPGERALTSASATSNAATSLTVTPAGMAAGDLLVGLYATDLVASGGGSVVVQGSTQATTGSGQATTLTVAMPAGIAAGDVAYLSVWSNTAVATSTFTTPSGWTAVVAHTDNSSANGSMACYRKVLAGSETQVVLTTSANTRMAGGLVTFTGADTSSPEAAVAFDNGLPQSTTTSVVAPSVTGVAGGRLLTAHGGQAAVAGDQPTWTVPAGMTERADAATTSATSRNATIEVNTQIQADNTATGTRTATASLAVNQRAALSVMVRPAGSTPSDITHQASPGWAQIGTTQVQGGLGLSTWWHRHQPGTFSPALGVYPDQTTTQIGLDLDHLQAAGVKTLWLVLAMEVAFPTSTTLDATFATKLDACVNGAQARGMTVAVQAHGMPTWITTASGHTANTWHGPDTAGERTNWIGCLHTFINRYGATKIGWVEIWNEPNLTQFWVQGWNNADYAHLLRESYLDIKATWPTIKVVGHNMSRNHYGWLDQHYAWCDSLFGAVTAAANKYYFDVLGIHPYAGTSTSGYDPADTSHGTSLDEIGGLIYEDYTGYRTLYQAVVTKEGTAKPLAFGEFGYSTTGPGWFTVTETQRAIYLATAMQLARGDGYVDYLNVHYHRPIDAVTDHETGFNIHPSTGPTSTEAAFTVEAGASATTHIFSTTQGTSQRMAVAVRAFLSADPTAPIDGAAVQSAVSAAASFTHGPNTSSGANRRWVLATAKTFAAAGASTMNTPATFTETVDLATSSATLTNLNAALDYKTVGSGATGTQQVTSSDATSQTWVGISFLVTAATGTSVTPVVDAAATISQTITLSAVATLIASTAPPPEPPGVVVTPDELWFNGSYWPKVHIQLGLGGTLDPGPEYLHFGVGPGLGTAKLAGTAWVDLDRHIRSVSISGRGRDGPIDPATPATATIVLNNGTSGGNGAYDPDNPASPYASTSEVLTDTQPALNYTQSGQTSPSSSGCTNSTVTMISGGSLHDMGGAAAASPNGTSPAVPAGTYTFWQDLPAGYDQVRWQLRPDLDPTSAGAGYFWFTQGTIQAAAGGAGNLWYAGLQSRSSLAGNPKAVVFSVWNASGAAAGSLTGTIAAPFTNEGVGWQIMAPFDWTAGTTYTLRVRADATRGSRWFACYLRDATGTETWVGSIQAGPSDSDQLYGVSYQITELFAQTSPAATCPLLPRATTFFSTPTFSRISPTAVTGGLELGVPVRVVAERPLGTVWSRFYGEITAITLDAGLDPTVTLTCADGLEKLGRVQLTHQGAPVGDGDRSGGRVNRILNAAGYPTAQRSVAAGYTIVAPTVYGDTALELLRQVEMTEFGFLYVDGSGTLVFFDRHQAATAVRSTTAQATFSDADSPTEPGMVDLELDWSRDRTFNDVHITRNPVPTASVDGGDDEPVEQVATDLTTQGRWGTLSLPAQVGQVLRDDQQALAMAQYLVARFSLSQSRVRKITVNALRRDYWDILLRLGLLDRIKIIRNYGPRVIVEELLIEGMTEEINSDPPTWTITLATTNPIATPTLWRIGTSAFGSGRLGW